MNYICFGGFFRLHYLYIDSNNYTADSVFYNHKIPVKFGEEYTRKNDKYRVIFCTIKKKHKHSFEKALNELKNKMALCGYSDYDEYCETFMEEMNE